MTTFKNFPDNIEDILKRNFANAKIQQGDDNDWLLEYQSNNILVKFGVGQNPDPDY